jgi:hypothetical protein
VRGIHNKLGEGERKVRLGQDSLPNIHFHSGNERKLGTLFYPHPLTGWPTAYPWILGCFQGRLQQSWCSNCTPFTKASGQVLANLYIQLCLYLQVHRSWGAQSWKSSSSFSSLLHLLLLKSYPGQTFMKVKAVTGRVLANLCSVHSSLFWTKTGAAHSNIWMRFQLLIVSLTRWL